MSQKKNSPENISDDALTGVSGGFETNYFDEHLMYCPTCKKKVSAVSWNHPKTGDLQHACPFCGTILLPGGKGIKPILN